MSPFYNNVVSLHLGSEKLSMIALGRLLIIIGLATAFFGLLLLVAVRYFPWLGNLPGDFRYESENLKIYFPLATMILISLLATILINVLLRIFHR